MNDKYYTPLARQRGAVLFVGLILMVVLSLLAFASLRTATLQERMSGNQRDRTIAFQAAEAALRAAEQYMSTGSKGAASYTVSGGTVTCVSGVFKMTDNIPYFVTNNIGDSSTTEFWNNYPWETANCSHTDNVSFIGNDDLKKAGKPQKLPRYVIEEISPNTTGVASYRITAKGWGTSENAVVILQATYTSN